jgi:hypothetical protein
MVCRIERALSEREGDQELVQAWKQMRKWR